VGIPVTNPELAEERLSWHIKNLDTSQSHLDCKGYSCHEGPLSVTWHQSHHAVDGVMVHPSDGEAWKHFNSVYPHFSAESRNVRLGLCTDGFNPFGSFSAPYSCWPVILMVYNLPPGMCMRPEFMFLSMVIPGWSSPGRNIDVCLRPLIDELT